MHTVPVPPPWPHYEYARDEGPDCPEMGEIQIVMLNKLAPECAEETRRHFGTQTPERVAEIEAHVKTCELCASRVECFRILILNEVDDVDLSHNILDTLGDQPMDRGKRPK